MSNDECNCQRGNSGFIFGLILGAFIAAAIMVLNSKNKDKIIKNIKDKFNDFFKEEIKENSKKISVTIPKDLIPSPPAPIPQKPAKLFKKK